MNLLDEKPNAMFTELTSCFFLLFHWIKDPSLPAEADATYDAYMKKFPYQQFIVELHKRAADADVTLGAATKQYFTAPVVGSSPYLNYSRIDHYVALTSIGQKVNISY